LRYEPAQFLVVLARRGNARRGPAPAERSALRAVECAFRFARPRDAHAYVRAPARIFLGRPRRVLLRGMANHFKIRPLTPRKRAYLEDQRERNVSAAFARLERALDNMARPAWGRSTPDRLAYLQAKFDRRVADSGSRLAAAMLIEEWRQRSLAGGPELGPDRPINELTDGEIARALSERRYGKHVAKADLRPPPPRPARAPRRSPRSRKA
jgi:hypothetical protein